MLYSQSELSLEKPLKEEYTVMLQEPLSLIMDNLV